MKKQRVVHTARKEELSQQLKQVRDRVSAKLNMKKTKPALKNTTPTPVLKKIEEVQTFKIIKPVVANGNSVIERAQASLNIWSINHNIDIVRVRKIADSLKKN